VGSKDVSRVGSKQDPGQTPSRQGSKESPERARDPREAKRSAKEQAILDRARQFDTGGQFVQKRWSVTKVGDDQDLYDNPDKYIEKEHSVKKLMAR
jgi:hypothetical protein